MINKTEENQLEIFKEGFLTKANYRQKVTEAEEFLLTLPQIDIPVNQHFLPGIYTREIVVPSGSVITGVVHKDPSIVVVSEGEIIVATEDGLQRIEAPYSFIAPAGTKRIAIVTKKCRWMNIHTYFGEPLSEDEMKKVIGFETYSEYEIWEAQKDFDEFVKETGLNDLDIKIIVSNENDITQCEKLDAHVDVSNISGFGMFADRDFRVGECVGPAIINGKRTILGRFVNHSPNPNIIASQSNNGLEFNAQKDIKKGSEMVVDYRLTNSIGGQ